MHGGARLGLRWRTRPADCAAQSVFAVAHAFLLQLAHGTRAPLCNWVCNEWRVVIAVVSQRRLNVDLPTIAITHHKWNNVQIVVAHTTHTHTGCRSVLCGAHDFAATRCQWSTTRATEPRRRSSARPVDTFITSPRHKIRSHNTISHSTARRYIANNCLERSHATCGKQYMCICGVCVCVAWNRLMWLNPSSSGDREVCTLYVSNARVFALLWPTNNENPFPIFSGQTRLFYGLYKRASWCPQSTEIKAVSRCNHKGRRLTRN